MSMSEDDYDDLLKQYIKSQIKANNEHPLRGIDLKDFYDGANVALEELAESFSIDLLED